MVIRTAQKGDRAALSRLGELLVRTHYEFDRNRFLAPTPGTAHGYGSFLASLLDDADVVVLVAEVDGEVVGYAYGSMEGHDWMNLRGPAGALHDILVDPAHRGTGIGARLLAAIVQSLEERGAPRVVLSTAFQNETAQRLFEAAGFRPTMIEMTRESARDGR